MVAPGSCPAPGGILSRPNGSQGPHPPEPRCAKTTPSSRARSVARAGTLWDAAKRNEMSTSAAGANCHHGPQPAGVVSADGTRKSDCSAWEPSGEQNLLLLFSSRKLWQRLRCAWEGARGCPPPLRSVLRQPPPPAPLQGLGSAALRPEKQGLLRSYLGFCLKLVATWPLSKLTNSLGAGRERRRGSGEQRGGQAGERQAEKASSKGLTDSGRRGGARQGRHGRGTRAHACPAVLPGCCRAPAPRQSCRHCRCCRSVPSEEPRSVRNRAIQRQRISEESRGIHTLGRREVSRNLQSLFSRACQAL